MEFMLNITTKEFQAYLTIGKERLMVEETSNGFVRICGFGLRYGGWVVRVDRLMNIPVTS